MNKMIRLLVMSGLVLGVACGDDDATFDGGMADGFTPDVVTPDAGDVCMGVDPTTICTTVGTSCTGDTLSRCAPNATGCLVTTTEDCAATGATCDDSGAVAMCSSDPCMGVTNCAAEARTCDADTLTVCAMDAMGCLVETTTDCTADGTTCDDTGAMAMCVDACDGISDCETEGRTCNADGELEVCAPDAAGCLVNTVTVCADSGAMCDDTVDPVACVAPPCAPADATGIVLDCATGTISGNTAGGTTSFNNYACSTFSYPGAENVYVFSNSEVARVTITTVRPSTVQDMDLYVLDGGDGTMMCSAMTTCLDSSQFGGASDEVEFDYFPGTTAYVAYDVFSDAALTSEYTLTVSCETSTCGDSTIEGAEVCDDGDADAGDGCSEFCQVEPGYVCTEDGAGLSTCALSCGDSEVNGADECDDGGTDDGDGCSATCTIETGYICTEDTAGLSTCALSCGDSEVNGDDECDDGGTDDGDGCSATCTIEAGFACEGEPSVCVVELALFEGELEDADSAWTRPDEDCAADTTDTVFDSYEYTNTTADPQVVDIVASYGYDGYLYVYDAAVMAADPTAGCIAGNDDGEGGTRTGLLEAVNVAAGATITIVVSSWSETGRGAYSISVRQP